MNSACSCRLQGNGESTFLRPSPHRMNWRESRFRFDGTETIAVLCFGNQKLDPRRNLRFISATAC